MQEYQTDALASSPLINIIPHTNGKHYPNSCLDAALAYARMGFRVLPVHGIRDGRCTCGQRTCATPGKHPRSIHGVYDATTDEVTIREWWRRWPDANVGIAMGHGLVALDIDPRSGGDAAWKALEEKYGAAPATLRSHSGGGGYHLIFRTDLPIGCRKGALPGGIDVRGRGGLIVVAPSLHVTGNRYAWAPGAGPGEEVEIAPLPAWVAELILADRRPEDGKPVLAEREVAEGGRHVFLKSMAAYLRSLGMRGQVLEDHLRDVDEARSRPPLSHTHPEEFRNLVAWADGLTTKEARRYADGKAQVDGPEDERGVDVASHYYTSGKFVPMRMVEELHDDGSIVWVGEAWWRYLDGAYVPTEEVLIQQEILERLGERARNHVINEVTDLLRKQAARPTGWLNPPEYRHLLNVENGMLDWRTGELLPHDKAYRSSLRIPVRYDPAVPYGPIVDAIADILDHDDERMRVLQEWYGYILIPDYSIQRILVLVGLGGNGKSVLTTWMRRLVGPANCAAEAIDKLAEDRFRTANLYGKLLNIAPEVTDKVLSDTSTVKRLTGGDPIDAERKFRDPFTFVNFARMVMSANRMPKTVDLSNAYYRRLMIIPLNRVYDPEVPGYVGQHDPYFAERLTTPENMSGLLNWALEGLRRLMQQREFTRARVIQEQREEYRRVNDSVQVFVEEVCDREEGARLPRAEAYGYYRQYCDQRGFRAVSAEEFYARLRAMGIRADLERKVKTSDGKLKTVRMIDGLRVHQDIIAPWQLQKHVVVEAG